MNNADVMERKRQKALKARNRIKSPYSLAMDILIHAIVGIAAFICLWPFIYVACMSISAPAAALAKKVWTFPVGPLTFAAYRRVANIPLMWRSYLNTIFYVISVCALNLVVCAMTAYPLATKGFRGRKFFVVYLMIPMFFGGGLIASFVTNVNLGLYGSPLAIILPSSLSITNVILIRSFFYNAVPDSLKEAAIIDGAGDMRVLFSIMIPLSLPIFAVITLYNAVGTWNSYFAALLYIPDRNWQPLQLFLAKLLSLEQSIISTLQSGAGTGDPAQVFESLSTAMQLKYAAIMFATLPILFSYPFLQRYFIKGIMIGSLKE